MPLRAEAVGLVVVALLLALPVPAALARARWPARDPRAALVLWQAVGLGGGLGILGAGLTLAAGSLAGRWLPGIAALPGRWSGLGPLGWAGLVLTVAVGLWLVLVTVTSGTRIALARRAHRQRLDAVAEVLEDRVGDLADASPGASGPGRTADRSPDGARTAVASRVGLAGVRFVDHPVAVAYCLPGLRSRVVVSSGALAALAPGELEAVLAHERAHARGRHDLVVQPFVAWRETFPFLSPATTALASVELLVEMLADDGARRRCDPAHLAGALRRLAAEHLVAVPGCGRRLDAQLAARLGRLAVPPRPLARPVRLLVYLAAVALVVLPPAVLLLT